MADEDKRTALEKYLDNKYGEGKGRRRSFAFIIMWAVVVVLIFFIVPLLIGMVGSGFIDFNPASIEFWVAMVIAGIIAWISGMELPEVEEGQTSEGEA